MKSFFLLIFHFVIIVSSSYGANSSKKQNFIALNSYIQTLPHTEEALYISEVEIMELANRFKLTSKQIKNAFSNFRRISHLVFKKPVNKKLWEVGRNWLQGGSIFLLSEIPVKQSQIPSLVLKDGRLYYYFANMKLIESTEIILSDAVEAMINSFNFNGRKTVLSAEECHFFNSVGAQIWIGKNLSDPYPTQSDHETIARMSNAKVSQVKEWFINIRRRKLDRHKQRKRTRDECIDEISAYSKKRRLGSIKESPALHRNNPLLVDEAPSIIMRPYSSHNFPDEVYPIQYCWQPIKESSLAHGPKLEMEYYEPKIEAFFDAYNYPQPAYRAPPISNISCWSYNYPGGEYLISYNWPVIKQPPPPTRPVEIKEEIYREPKMEVEAQEGLLLEKSDLSLDTEAESPDELLMVLEPVYADFSNLLTPGDDVTSHW